MAVIAMAEHYPPVSSHPLDSIVKEVNEVCNALPQTDWPEISKTYTYLYIRVCFCVCAVVMCQCFNYLNVLVLHMFK